MFESDIYGLALIAVGACGLLIYAVLLWPVGRLPGPWPHPFYRAPARFEKLTPPDLTDVGQQLHAVMAASFQRRRLLSRSEFEAFRIIETEIAAAARGHRVFAQTNLGEVLSSPDENAFRSINSKRVDILVVDQGGWPLVAVEYQGGGHYQGTAAARDAIKKEALRKAGVRYIEVSPDDSAEQIRSRVREQLGWQPPNLTTTKRVRRNS